MRIKDAANLRRRGPVVLASLAAVVGLTVSIPPATTASSNTASSNTASTNAQPAAPADSTQVTLDGVSPGTHVLTLITGDRVTLSSDGGARFSVDVQPAPRPDGEQPTFYGESRPDGMYVIPSDAAAAVAASRLDRELFDVKYLAESGYLDGQMPRLPVIAQYAKSREPAQVNRAAEALPASTQIRGLESIHGAALSVSRSNADAFWASIAPESAASSGSAAAATASSGLDRGLTGLWLDAKVHATLNESVPLIGAPQAWAAGFDGTGVKVAVLDTGIDATHPDLQSKVADAHSFVPGESVQDGNGHGTHVASTVAGTGAAEAGKYKGVAKGAQLVIGKVLSDAGTGQESWIIDGMEWAAHSGAKVVSMSLGGGPTDGVDPMSTAVNLLTLQTGTLFVIAAGNSGPDASTISAPGAANFALTVAATDKSDQVADFSSRGPRIDGALKPDIAAPGVNIVAASANNDENALCRRTPSPCLGNGYMQISGTSMATPHVAGAAAILAQEHPDWKAPQLKAALMSTATPTARLVGTIASGPHAGTEYAVTPATGTTPINGNTTISGTPTFAGQACESLPAADGVALVERGTCTFQTKLDNITAAGYTAGIVFNERVPVDGTTCLASTTMTASGDIQFVFVNRLTGLQLLQDTDATGDNACTKATPSTGTPAASTTVEAVQSDDTTYKQGAGRIDIARAVSQKVYATTLPQPLGQPWTPSVDFGPIGSAQSGPISKPVGYTNLTDQPVTLTLTPHLRNAGGEPAPDGALTVDATTLTVPAGGTATATATVDPTRIVDFGTYTGAITATADNVHLTTPVGLTNLAKLTIHVVHDQRVGGIVNVLPVELENPSEFRITRSLLRPTSADRTTVTALVVPGTYSVTAFGSWRGDDGVLNSVMLSDPQVTVTGDGTKEVTLDARQAKPITFTTPRSVGHPYWATRSHERTGADGNLYSSWSGGWSAGERFWALPTEKVTKGSFRYATSVRLSNPPVTMAVDQPEHQQLQVFTRAYADRGLTFGNTSGGFVPWTEDQKLRLVDAGFGDPEDLDDLDLHGKLALLRYGHLDDSGRRSCSGSDVVLLERIENVQQAGAVGIVFFPALGCPMLALPLENNIVQRRVPEVWLTPAEGQHLADLAANGTVVIDVDADPNVRYTYELKQYEEQQISDSLDYTYTTRDLAQIDTAYHASNPGRGHESWHAFKAAQNISFEVSKPYAVPQTRPVYLGPLSTDTVWAEQSQNWSQETDPETGLSGILDTVSRLWVLDQPIRTSQQRHTVPIAPGVPVSVDAAHAAKPDAIWSACSLCREGNTFWPTQWNIAGGQKVDMDGSLTRRLFRADGEEIPQNPGSPSFTLPEQPGTYRLVEDRTFTNGSTVGTTWTFNDAGTPQQSTVRPGYACLVGLAVSTNPCRPEPAIFLGYDIGDSLGLDNTVAAPGASTIRIRAYHAQSTEEMPAIAGLKLWASTDDGATWKQLSVAQQKRGFDATFRATVTHPAAAETSGAVSLKAEAWDTADNRIEQSLTRAYGLTARQ